MKSLTAAERETVVNWSDDDHMAHVWTAQRSVITKLKRIKAAKLINKGFYGSTAWAEFRLPAHLVSFRQEQKRVSAATRAKRIEALHKARAAHNSKTTEL